MTRFDNFDDRVRDLESRGGSGDIARALRAWAERGDLPRTERLVGIVLMSARTSTLLHASGDLAPPLTADEAETRLRMLDRCADADAQVRSDARAELRAIAVAEAAERRATMPWRYPPPRGLDETYGGAAPPAPSPDDEPQQSSGLLDPETN